MATRPHEASRWDGTNGTRDLTPNSVVASDPLLAPA